MRSLRRPASASRGRRAPRADARPACRSAVTVCVLLICLGTAIASYGEIGLSRLGLLLQLGANLSEASRVVLSQRLLATHRLPLLEMQYHVAPCALLSPHPSPAPHGATFAASPSLRCAGQAACLLCASALVELDDPAARSVAAAVVLANPGSFLLASALGLGLQAPPRPAAVSAPRAAAQTPTRLAQVITLLVIQLVGSLTMKVLGISRNAALVLFQLARGADDVSQQQLMGHGLSTAAFVAYSFLRVRAAPPPRIKRD